MTQPGAGTETGMRDENWLVEAYCAAKSEIVRLEAELLNAQGLLDEWQARAEAAERVVAATAAIVGDDGWMFEYDLLDIVQMSGGEFQSRLSALRHAYAEFTHPAPSSEEAR